MLAINNVGDRLMEAMVLAIRVLAIRVLAIRVLAIRVLAIRVLAIRVESYSFLKSARNLCGAFIEEEGEQDKR